MTTAIDYALMAGAAYRSNRTTENRFQIPAGWGEVTGSYRTLPSGFEAISFIKGTEVVISFAGTDFSQPAADFLNANIPLASGALSAQLCQAADYYLQVKALNPDAHITLTGHSLGAGLASLISVFFDEDAVTFDQAPFRAAAQGHLVTDSNGVSVTQSAAQDLRAYLHGEGVPDAQLAKLDSYIVALDVFNASPIAADTLAGRETKVTNINVLGEVLSSAPVNALSRIGSTQADTTSLANSGAGVSSVDLHSQALLTAFLQSGDHPGATAAEHTLGQATFRLPDLLAMLFSGQLFAHPVDSTSENFLERMVKHQAGIFDPATGAATLAPDQMVTRFTHDLWKLSQDGGLTLHDNNPSNPDVHEVSDTLIAFAMQKYYEETDQSAGYGKELFTDIAADGGAGGIRFDMADVSATFKAAFDNNQPVNLSDAKGYGLYFINYLASTNNFSAEQLQAIQSLLPSLRDWYVQAGSAGMTAVDTQNRGAFMLGGAQDDFLMGGAKADLLIGNSGNNRLEGGGGNDTLIGGANNDVFAYMAGDGNDTVYETGGASDVLQLMGLTSSQTNVTRVGNDLQFAFATGGSVSVKGWYNGSDYKIESIQFGDVWWTADQAEQAANGNYLAGTELTDTLTGAASQTNRIYGLGGNDTLTGGQLADVIDGGDGNDTIYGGYGADTLYGGAGNDQIWGGNNSSYNYDTAGNTFIGGAGNDTLYGTAFADTYIFNLGDGQDTIVEYGAATAAGVIDSLQFGQGISAADLAIVRSGSDLILKLANGTDQVDVASWYASTDNSRKLEQVAFADGTVWDTNYLTATGLNVAGTAGADTLTGVSNWANQLYGLGGNDTLTGGTLADVIDGGDDNDMIYGGYGADTLMGGAGNDQIWGGNNSAYNYDTAGNTFIGGTGNDRLYGTAFADTYLFNLGDGQDIISTGDSTALDTLQFGTGIATTDVSIVRSGTDLALKLANSTDQVTIGNWYWTSDPKAYKLGRVTFADGTVWNTDYLTAAGLNVSGTAGADTLAGVSNWANQLYGLGGNDTLTGGTLADVIDGGDGNDTIFGGYGADTLYGGAGNDQIWGGNNSVYNYDTAGNTFIGGPGNDVLYGTAYADTYLFNLGDGQDTIVEYGAATAAGVNDTLQFGQGIAAADISAIRSGSDLILKLANGTDQVDVASWYWATDNSRKLEQVAFADGTSISSTAGIEALVTEFWGTNASETLTASNNIHTLIGGKGNDTLVGSLAQDAYLFNLGDGQDTVNTGDTAGQDTLVFEDSFAATTLTASRSTNDLLLSAGSGDKVTMAGWFSNGNQANVLLPGNNLVSAAAITNYLTAPGNNNAFRIL